MNTKTIKSKLDKFSINDYNEDTILRFSDRLHILDDEVAQVIQYLNEKGMVIRDVMFNNFNSGSTNEPEMTVHISLETIKDDDYKKLHGTSEEMMNRWKNVRPALYDNYVEVSTYSNQF